MGTKSPMAGTNSIAFIKVERLLRVMADKLAIIIPSAMSPITGVANSGAPA